MRSPCLYHPETGKQCQFADKDKDFIAECSHCIYRRAYIYSLDLGVDTRVEFRKGQVWIAGRVVLLAPAEEATQVETGKQCKFPGCESRQLHYSDYCPYHQTIIYQRKYNGWPESRWHDPVRLKRSAAK